MNENNVQIAFTGDGTSSIAESKKVVAGIDTVRAAAKQAGEEGSENLSLLQETLGEISTLVAAVGDEFKALGQDIYNGVRTDVVDSGVSKVKEGAAAVGNYIKGSAEKTAAATAAWYFWGSGVSAAVEIAFTAISSLILAYKGLSFAEGLLTGESYKSANINAVIATNKEVKELQTSLHLTSVEAGAVNDALRRLGVNKADIIAVKNGANSALPTDGDPNELDRLGVTYKGANGAILDTQTIVQNAKNVLDQYTEGWDRNQAAVALGIGSYEQITNYLKVNQAEIAKSKARLDEFNLGLGPESQLALAAYQAAMLEFSNEQELSSQGFKRAIADNIMPVLTDLANFWKNSWPSVVNIFRYTMAEFTSLFLGLRMDVDMIVDVIKVGFGSVGDIVVAVTKAAGLALTGDFTGAGAALAKGWEDVKSRVGKTGKEIADDARHNAAAMKMAWGFDDRTDPNAGKPKKGKSFVAKPDEEDDTPDTTNSNYQQLVKAAKDAYRAYLKADGEQQAAIVKANNAKLEEQNSEAYAWGLINLQTYLATKHTLNEEALQAEITARQNELKSAQTAEKEALSAYAKDPTGDTAKNVNESYQKVADATKAVTEAQSKLTIAKLTDADETHKLTDDQLRGYQSIQAQMLDMQGKYVAAALIQKALDESSVDRQKLITEAMKGTAGAEAAYWAQEALDQNKLNEATKKNAAEEAAITIAQISNQLALVDTAEKFFKITAGDAALQRIDLLKQQLVAQQKVYDNIQGNEPAALTARLQYQAAINTTNEKLLEQQKILSDRTAMGGAITALHDYANLAQNIGAQVSGGVTNFFQSMDSALTSFVVNGKLNFKSFADAIISDLVRIAIQQSVTGPLAAGASSFISSMFGASKSSVSVNPDNGYSPGYTFQALGGAWDRGVQKFAAGGVVTGPTSFQTASGAGLMGEAGPEAIMPLTRTASGALGVQVVGGSGQGAGAAPTLTVNIVNNSGSQMSASQSSPKFDQAKGWVIGVVVENISNGGVLRTMMQGGS